MHAPPLPGAHGSAESAVTLPVTSPVCRGLPAKLILGLRAEVTAREPAGSTGSTPCPPTTSLSASRARECSGVEDGIAESGSWTSASRPQNNAWTSTGARSLTSCSCCESAAV
eukprot:3780209-Pyramimonas_sp.AAC.1